MPSRWSALHTLSNRCRAPRDYIALPKAQRLPSLHTTLIGPFGNARGDSNRTADMHMVPRLAWRHWMPGSLGDKRAHRTFSKNASVVAVAIGFAVGHRRPRLEFLEHIKVVLFPDSVYVLAHGQDSLLRKDATAIDPRLRHPLRTSATVAVAARINEEDVPLSTRLKNGDRAEILTKPGGPMPRGSITRCQAAPVRTSGIT